MSMAFKTMASIVAVGADPNATPPLPANVFAAGRRSENDELTDGIGFWLQFTVVTDATIEVWVRDGASGAWALVTSFVALTAFAYRTVRSIRTADVFLRVTATTGAFGSVTPKIAQI